MPSWVRLYTSAEMPGGWAVVGLRCLKCDATIDEKNLGYTVIRRSTLPGESDFLLHAAVVCIVCGLTNERAALETWCHRHGVLALDPVGGRA